MPVPTELNCPSWCTQDHGDSPSGNAPVRHVGELVEVPVMVGEPPPGGPGELTARASEFVAVISQSSTEPEPWVFIGESDHNRQYLRVSPESLQRLLTVLSDGRRFGF